MYPAILLATSWARSAVGFFVRLGVFGPLLLETLDSSYLYLPLANELLLTALITRDPDNLIWIVYVVSGAAGSVAGVFLLDLLARKAGEKGLEKLVGRRQQRWVKARLERHAGWAFFAASAMPPPFPFRPVMLTASALQSPRAKMLTGVFFGRLLRFGVEALLIIYFGRRLLAFMNSPVFEYAVYALTAAGLLGSVLLLRKWFLSRRA